MSAFLYMDNAMLGRFVITVLVVNMLALIITQAVSPPDPFTIVTYYVPLVPVVILISYLLVYRNGFDRIGELT